MQSHCPCPKWFDVLSLDQVYTVMYKYLTQPEYGRGFSIHQPCFMCRNEDRTESYATDEFTARELFGNLPHPETLNHYFVGHKDTKAPPPPVMPELVSVGEIRMKRFYME